MVFNQFVLDSYMNYKWQWKNWSKKLIYFKITFCVFGNT
jgi:hypothetical protein